MLALADANNAVEALPAAAAAAGPSTTSERSPATSSPDSSLPLMWDAAPSPGPQPLVIPSGPSCPTAASIKLSSAQSTTQTTTTMHPNKQTTAKNAVAAVSSSAVQFDLAGLLSKAMTTAQRKKDKKQRSPVRKGDNAGGMLQPATELSATSSAAAQAARKPMSGQAVNPDQEAAILEKARQLRAERQAEEALIKAISGSSAAAAAHGSASQPAVDKKAAKQMAAKKRAERLALKQAESRAKKAAAEQQATAEAEVAPEGADQLAPVAEAGDKSAAEQQATAEAEVAPEGADQLAPVAKAGDKSAAEAAPIDQGAGGDAVKDTAAQPTCDADVGPAEAAPIDQGAGEDTVKDTAAQPTSDVDMGSASADAVAANVASPADNEADREPAAAKGALEDIPSGTLLAANETAVQQVAGQVAGDAIAAQEGVAEPADNMAASAVTADQTAAEAAAADKEGSEVAVANSTAAEAALGDSLAAEAAAAVEPAESGQAVAQEPAGNAAADEKEADDAVTRAAGQNTSEAAAGHETADKASAPESSFRAGAVSTAPLLKTAETSGVKAAADKDAAQTPAEPANTVKQAATVEIAMPEPIAGQQPAIGVAAAGIEVTEPISAEVLAADRTANKIADDTFAAANEAASKGAVQHSAAVARAVQEAAQPAQEAAQAVQEASQAGFSQSAGRVTPTKPQAAPQNLQAPSTGFGPDKSPPQNGDEPEPDRGFLFTRSVIPNYLSCSSMLFWGKSMTEHLTLYQALQQSHGAGSRLL